MSSEDRKSDHIELAGKSQIEERSSYPFAYEPMLGSLYFDLKPEKIPFLRYELSHPLWISSMTGGTVKAKLINRRLALAAQKFGLGMGLGSCRPLLKNDDRLEDFQVKSLMPHAPLMANLGIAQVEELLSSPGQIKELVKKCECDGLFIHINPLQELRQPEGDSFSAPIDTIKKIIELLPDLPLFIKEVGQGFGPRSLKALAELPIQGVELAGFGGTNFTHLEGLRNESFLDPLSSLGQVGHSSEEMLAFISQLNLKFEHTILSGGVRDPLRAHQLLSKAPAGSLVGMGYPFMKAALESQEVLEQFITQFLLGLQVCREFLKMEGQ